MRKLWIILCFALLIPAGCAQEIHDLKSPCVAADTGNTEQHPCVRRPANADMFYS